MTPPRQVLITGATSGIGLAAARELARRGHAVAVLGRNQTTLDSLTGELKDLGSPTTAAFRADLSDLAATRGTAEEIAATLPVIDVLVNNAGIASSRAHATPEGYDEMLASNYLGPFLLTHLLLDSIRRSAAPRIVITGSEAHRTAGRFDPERFEDLGDYRNLAAQLAYGRTKLLDILWADELARRLDDFTVRSCCPGLVSTGLVRELGPRAERIGHAIARTPLIRRPEQGARVLVHLATETPPPTGDGGFVTSTPGMARLPRVGPRRDPAVAARVYERTCELLGLTPLP